MDSYWNPVSWIHIGTQCNNYVAKEHTSMQYSGVDHSITSTIQCATIGWVSSLQLIQLNLICGADHTLTHFFKYLLANKLDINRGIEKKKSQAVHA